MKFKVTNIHNSIQPTEWAVTLSGTDLFSFHKKLNMTSIQTTVQREPSSSCWSNWSFQTWKP